MFFTKTATVWCLLLLFSCVDTNEYPFTTFRNATDLRFQGAASKDNYDVLNEGTIATKSPLSPPVIAYAQELLGDRRAAQEALKKIADSVNQQLPDTPAIGDGDLRLAAVAGALLDTTYLRETMRDQDSAITLYRDEIANGSYVGLIHYAIVYLPQIQLRRQEADSLFQLLQRH